MENLKYNNVCYNVAIQGMNRANTSTYQKLCKILWTFLWHCLAIQKKWVKYVLKNGNIMQKWCVYMFWIFFMLLICNCMLPLHWWGLRLLYTLLCLSNFCDYALLIFIWIILLIYILMIYFFMIPVDTATMLLQRTLSIQNTHLEISWKIPSLTNWESSYMPIVKNRTLLIIWPKVTFLCMLPYFDVGGIQRVFILHLVIFSLSYIMTWDVERLLLTGSSEIYGDVPMI